MRDISRVWTTVNPAAPGSAEPLSTLEGAAATEAAVVQASAGRRVVHYATHGFVLGDPCAAPGTRGVGGLVPARVGDPLQNPLALAGLAFAGANTRRRSASADDGILTGEEVASMNLQGTEWAVLSACDTGLGPISASEGVLGLRRAFQIAGARTVIMSLWPVEDEAARQWMRALYEAKFQRGMSTADAVRHAQVTMLNARRTRGQSTHPRHWAPFVAAGEWN
jgi:CHAT domain-containing protein